MYPFLGDGGNSSATSSTCKFKAYQSQQFAAFLKFLIFGWHPKSGLLDFIIHQASVLFSTLVFCFFACFPRLFFYHCFWSRPRPHFSALAEKHLPITISPLVRVGMMDGWGSWRLGEQNIGFWRLLSYRSLSTSPCYTGVLFGATWAVSRHMATSSHLDIHFIGFGSHGNKDSWEKEHVHAYFAAYRNTLNLPEGWKSFVKDGDRLLLNMPRSWPQKWYVSTACFVSMEFIRSSKTRG